MSIQTIQTHCIELAIFVSQKTQCQIYHEMWLKHWTNCPKWRLHKKGGLVAYAWCSEQKLRDFRPSYVTNRHPNPRFPMPIFGPKTGFPARMNKIKSGIWNSGNEGREHTWVLQFGQAITITFESFLILIIDLCKFMLPKRRFWKT